MKRMKTSAMKVAFTNTYKDKTILITGDTGFKGSWLSIWLTLLGANVIGYSDRLPSKPCMFAICGIGKHVKHVKGDVRDYDSLKKVFIKHKPDFVFHLASQPIVSRAYRDPKTTFETNVRGTVNVLECMRHFLKDSVGVIITSDKCYKNKEWNWGYRETDELGGNDPYSSSKACAELICHSYYRSFFDGPSSHCRIATARAGNVIGGGDWAADRIVPDSVRAWSKKEMVYIRNPKATRPWQHVLEPLSGYLWLGSYLSKHPKLNGESFNFGPDYKVSESVSELIKMFSKHFSDSKWKCRDSRGANTSKESQFLKVSCDKALKFLNWYAVLPFGDTIKMTAEWYEEYYKNKNNDMLYFTITQIERYIKEAKRQGLAWAKD
ncbi:MAG: CDP-glucose 4,6-dehydratase [Candidatus Omnitrophica bacterium]|nr:CDP-glucose 4,6-dehydratase [Candidatus Omnitrophota bacterium]